MIILFLIREGRIYVFSTIEKNNSVVGWSGRFLEGRICMSPHPPGALFNVTVRAQGNGALIFLNKDGFELSSVSKTPAMSEKTLQNALDDTSRTLNALLDTQHLPWLFTVFVK